MEEHDPTAVDPDEVTEPAFDVVEDQTPPKGFEPQPPLQDGQDEGIVERGEDVIETAEAAEPDLHQEEDGEADDGDDAAEEED